MISDYIPLLVNHLWQSTVFVVMAGLLALALRNNQARIRYWIWLAASLKFLVPFSLLVDFGSRIEWRTAHAISAVEWPIAVEQISPPFITPLISSRGLQIVQPASAIPVPVLLLLLWGCGSVAVLSCYWLRWRPIQTATRDARCLDFPLAVKVLSSPALLEPAVFGIFKPVLLVPEAIADRLTPGQLQAIFAHELYHIRHRDNLTAAVHMMVQSIFWFHPLVWLVGARLVEERERACDEAVMESGHEPEVYAQAIVEVCKLYLESPLACVAGVSGANLKARIERIMTARIGLRLSVRGKLLLAMAGTMAIATPVLLGLIKASPRQIQPSKENQSSQSPISIKLSRSRKLVPGLDHEALVVANPGKYTLTNASLRDLVRMAYRLPQYRIAGGPEWMDFHHYEIAVNGPQNLRRWDQRIMPMFQTLLQDRFKLKFHYETRELPVYVLTVAKGGAKLQPSKERNCTTFEWRSYPPGQGQNAFSHCGALATGPNIRLNHTLDAVGMSIAAATPNDGSLANVLSAEVRHPVIDKTGLTGLFDIRLEWNFAATARALGSEIAGSVDQDNPSVFDALQQQLGLKLEADKGPVEVLVADYAEKPFE